MSSRSFDCDAIYALIPHSGSMRLLDTVTIESEQQAFARATSHHNVDNPLRVDGYLPSFHALEYAAQVIAVHGVVNLADHKKHDAMFVAAFRDVSLSIAPLDAVKAQPLDIYVSLTAAIPGSWSYAFHVNVKNNDELIEIARGRAFVAVPGEK